MKPVSLTLQAFGPFNKTEHIDFSQIDAAHGLFLICGDTGSGKSTLLDAISYALFDDTPADSSQRDAATLRSQLAEPELATQVTFEFVLRGERYRIMRSPKQPRPRKRGDGYTEQNSLAEFIKFENGGETALAAQPKLATQTVQQLLGFSATQFRQIVVLPQGRFDRFLAAESKDREKILSELFDSDRYQQIEAALKQSRNALEKSLTDLHSKREALLNSVGIEDMSELTQTIDDATTAHTGAQQKLTLDAASLAQKLKALTEALAIDELFVKLDKAQKQVAAIEATRAEQTARQQRLQLAQKAAGLSDLKEELATLKRDSDAQHKNLKDAQAALKSAEQVQSASAMHLKQANATKPEIDSLSTELGQLKQLESDVSELPAIENQLSEAGQHLTDLTKQVELLSTQRSTAQSQLEQLRKDLLKSEADFVSPEVIKLNGRKVADTIKNHDALAGAQQELLDHHSELESKGQARDQQSQALDKLKQKQQHLQQCFNEGQATLLARNLNEGEPCPVCGSTRHQNYADAKIDIPQESDIQAIGREIDQQQSTLQQTQARIAALEQSISSDEARVRDLEKQLGGDKNSPRSTLVTERDALREKYKHQQSLETQIDELKRKQTPLEQTLTELETKLNDAQKAQSSANTLLAQIQTRHQERTKRLPEALRTRAAYDELVHSKSERLAQLEQSLAEATQASNDAVTNYGKCKTGVETLTGVYETAEAKLKGKREQWTERRQQAGFEDDELLNRSLLDEAAQADLARQIDQYERDRNEAMGELKGLQNDCSGVKPVNTAELQAKHLQAEQLWQTTSQQVAQLNSRLDQLKNCRQAIDASAKEQQQLDRKFGVIGKIADAANGNNPLQLTLHRFVLGVLLDEVLAAANIRLAEMSRGRYSLKRRHGAGDGRKKGGLELDVYDEWTSDQRPVSTLSGGESFEAALALSLGLAEVSQNHAGGIQLDTLFIDEGFGSLDQDSLDRVMHTLTRLKQSKRMVGIISHVNELKERIDVRLEVESGPTGSRTKWTGIELTDTA